MKNYLKTIFLILKLKKKNDSKEDIVFSEPYIFEREKLLEKDHFAVESIKDDIERFFDNEYEAEQNKNIEDEEMIDQYFEKQTSSDDLKSKKVVEEDLEIEDSNDENNLIEKRKKKKFKKKIEKVEEDEEEDENNESTEFDRTVGSTDEKRVVQRKKNTTIAPCNRKIIQNHEFFDKKEENVEPKEDCFVESEELKKLKDSDVSETEQTVKFKDEDDIKLKKNLYR